MKTIDRIKKSELTVNHLGFIKVSKRSIDRTLDEVEFKRELFKLATPLAMHEDSDYLGIDVEKWLCHSHSLFRKVPDGEIIPTYEVEIDQMENGSIVIVEVKEIK